MKKVAVIIVNWNGKDDTVVCLDSLKQMDTRRVDIELVVVDNGSTNDSVKVISAKHPQVTLLATGKNLGFTGGSNIGIRHAVSRGAEFVWLLNNDTIVHPDALQLVDAFDYDSVGVAGSKIYFAPGHEYHKERYAKSERGKIFWYAGGLVDWDNLYASHRGVDEVDRGQFDVEIDTPFVTGCSLMIRRSVIEKIGLLDDRFFAYLEDVDYSLRARSAGWRVMYYPKSMLWHVNAGSSGGAGSPLHEYYLTRNRLLVGMRYAPVRTKFALLRESGRFLVDGPPGKRKAIVDALLGKWGKQYEPTKINN